jgi:hypothetical protein
VRPHRSVRNRTRRVAVRIQTLSKLAIAIVVFISVNFPSRGSPESDPYLTLVHERNPFVRCRKGTVRQGALPNRPRLDREIALGCNIGRVVCHVRRIIAVGISMKTRVGSKLAYVPTRLAL